MPLLSRRHWTHTLSLLVMLLVSHSASAGLPVAVGGEKLPTLAPILERTSPAVVNVFTRATVEVRSNPLFNDPFFQRFFDIPEQRNRTRETQSLGSGVIIDAKKGYILTNNHVIKGADTIKVTLLDGRTLEAKLVGTDADSDVAVLQVPADKLKDIPLADSNQLRAGDFVIAIGNPFGLGHSVTSGIVSALERSGLGIERYENFIQTDASINPGNSGGALIDLNGHLIGINTAIYSKSGANNGIGFAIPINMAKDIMQQLIEHGRVQRGRLGAQAQDLTPELARAFDLKQRDNGAVVVNVIPGSPAETAGLKVGDVVVMVNNRPVRSAEDLRNFIGLLRVGTEVNLDILRDSKQRHIVAKIEKSEVAKIDAAKLHRRLSGATLATLTEEHRAYGQVEGIVVLAVERNSPAAAAGLRKGDLVTAINKKIIRSPAEALALRDLEKGRFVLNILRGQRAMYILLR